MSKYKEIFKLKTMLEEADIPFDYYDKNYKIDEATLLEHYHINYPSQDNCIISAIEGDFTYGSDSDLLEIMGGLTEEEAKGDTVVGWLTAEDVFTRIKNHYEGNK